MALPPEYANAFEALRTQLSQLSTSIALLRTDLERSNPLPSWPSLQSSAAMLGVHLNAVNNALSGHRTLLANTHAYPLHNFPGHTQESLLQQLLRKKLDPRAEDWIEASMPIEQRTINGSHAEQPLKDHEVLELLRWATPATNRIIKPLWDTGGFDDDFTQAERRAGIKIVKTGLKRKLGKRLPEEYDELEEGASDDEDDGTAGEEADDDHDHGSGTYDDEDAMGGHGDMDVDVRQSEKADPTESTTHGISAAQPAAALSTLLKLASTGEVARHGR